jgi:hypothetical protein
VVSGSGGVETRSGEVVISSSAGMGSSGFQIPFGTGLSYFSRSGASSNGFGKRWLAGSLAGLKISGGTVYYTTSPTSTKMFTSSSGSGPGSSSGS